MRCLFVIKLNEGSCTRIPTTDNILKVPIEFPSSPTTIVIVTYHTNQTCVVFPMPFDLEH